MLDLYGVGIQSRLVNTVNGRESFKPFIRGLLVIFLSTLLLFILIQSFLWKQHSLEATYVQLKNIFVERSLDNYIELGAICNSLGDFECSEKYFNKVIEINPNNKLGLANLGIILAKKKDWKKSQSPLKAYFSLGGRSFDVLYWYGLSLFHTGETDLGLGWILGALKENPTFFDAAELSTDYFFKSNQTSTALSLIGAITSGHPETSDYWYSFLAQERFTSLIESEAGAEDNWTLLSLDGVHYYLPLVLKEHTRVKYFSVFDDVDMNLVNTDILQELRIAIENIDSVKTIQLNDRNLQVHKVLISGALVLGKSVGDLEFYVCEKCPNILGKPFLKNYQLEFWSDLQVDFLSLHH